MPGTSTPAEPSRARTAGSSLAAATRWSSGPSTATVELVSVSPYALTKSVVGEAARAPRSMMRAGIGAPPYASERSVGTAAFGHADLVEVLDDPGQHRGHDERVRDPLGRARSSSHVCGVNVVRCTTRRPA